MMSVQNWIIYIRFLEKNKDSSKNIILLTNLIGIIRVFFRNGISFLFFVFFFYFFVRKTVAKRIEKHDASRKHSFYVGSVGQDVGFNRLVAMILFDPRELYRWPWNS